MNCCSQTCLFHLIIILNMQAILIYIYFTWIDVKPSPLWVWMDYLAQIFVYGGILLYLSGIWRWIRVIFKPDGFLNGLFCTSVWMEVSVVSLWLSSVFEQKWILAGILITHSCSNPIIVKLVCDMDPEEYDDHNYHESDSNLSRNDNENEPLLAATTRSINTGVGDLP